MQKVVTINLNGNAYQLDEAGYGALVAYLEGADRSLKDNPDRAEILADLEQAIADKCRGFLGPHKTVVTAAEVDQIIREMGPVDGAAGTGGGSADGEAAKSSPGSEPGPGGGAPRRLYLIDEGSMFAGVCTGLAAYLHVDVTIIRIVFLLLALVTRGGFGLVYLVLAFVIPPADTSEQRAAAHGQPFNAQQLIDRAKQNYASFAGRHDWRRRWRSERRAWRHGWRPVPPSAAGAYPFSTLGGLRAALLTVVFTMLAWFWGWTLFSLVIRGHVFGQAWPGNLPPWMGIVALVVLFQFVAWPLRFARRRAYYAPGAAHYYDGPLAALGGMLSIAFWVLIAWLAYEYVPEVREIVRSLPDVWNSFWESVSG
jgi:phage shock protein PspC (stress-responsive transcriptional regulator)